MIPSKVEFDSVMHVLLINVHENHVESRTSVTLGLVLPVRSTVQEEY